MNVQLGRVDVVAKLGWGGLTETAAATDRSGPNLTHKGGPAGRTKAR